MLRYKRGCAIALCVLTTLTPITAMAAGQTSALPEPAAQSETALPDAAVTGLADKLAEGLKSLPELSLVLETVLDSAPPGGSEELLPAEEVPAAATPEQTGPRIVLNGQAMSLAVSPVIQNATTFVPIRSFCEAMGCTVAWLGDSGVISVTGPGLTLALTLGSKAVTANGRFWYMDAPCQLVEGSAMIPVRAMAKIFTCTVGWNAAAQTVELTGGAPLLTAEQFYDQEDLLWLARIIWCESGNQSLEGKVAVGNVILNRVKNPTFPNTIYDVIFDRRYGVQFTPTRSGSIYCTPPEACYTAARLALEGYETAPGCLYFVSLRSNNGCWANRNRACFGTIGGHVFYL